MAHIQHRRKAAPAEDLNDKENQPPRNPKKAQPSASNLLKKSKSKHRTARDVLAPLPDGISKKAKVPRADFFKRFAKKRKGSYNDPLRVVPGFFRKINHDEEREHALDTGYASAAHAYCESAAAEAKKRVELRQAELAARRNGLDLGGRPLRRKGYPSKEDFDKVFAQMEDLTKPLEDQMIDVEFKDANTGKPYFRQVRVGSTLDKFFERHSRKQAVVADIAKEIREVDEEIAGLVERIQREKAEMEKGSAEMEEEMAGLQREIDEAENQYQADMKALKRQLQAQSNEVKRKISDLKALVS